MNSMVYFMLSMGTMYSSMLVQFHFVYLFMHLSIRALIKRCTLPFGFFLDLPEICIYDCKHD
jgi:hypothetical protein